VVLADCRELLLDKHGYGEKRLDVIVSEMIGSFGCNELAPDILGFLPNLVSKSTIFIPRSFKSFIEPIGSQPLVN